MRAWEKLLLLLVLASVLVTALWSSLFKATWEGMMPRLWLSGVHTPVRHRGPRLGHLGITEVVR